MMKSLPLFGLVVLALAACGDKSNEKPPNSAAASAAASTSGTLPETANLKIYNWSDYVDPATVAAFEKQYGVAVKYDYYDSDETLESKMLTGKSGYDLAGPSNAFIGRQIKAGAYQKLDKSLIPNYKNINPKLLALMQEVDPGNDYAVPFFWGTNTFAINTERVKNTRHRRAARQSMGFGVQPRIHRQAQAMRHQLSGQRRRSLPDGAQLYGQKPQQQQSRRH